MLLRKSRDLLEDKAERYSVNSCGCTRNIPEMTTSYTKNPGVFLDSSWQTRRSFSAQKALPANLTQKFFPLLGYKTAVLPFLENTIIMDKIPVLSVLRSTGN